MTEPENIDEDLADLDGVEIPDVIDPRLADTVAKSTTTARLMRGLYDAYVTAGFTEEQAMRLLTALVSGSGR